MSGCVAVLVPAYNARLTIDRAITSALSQEETAEVVVVDDGSTDGTAEAAAACDDGTGRLQVIRKTNGGPGSAVNRGRIASQAPFFCVLDSDDFFLPGRLREILAGAGGDWDMAADRLFLTEQGREEGPYLAWGGRIPSDGTISLESFVRGNITNPARPRTELGYLQPLFRRAFFDRHGLWHDETMRLGEDYFFYASALAKGARFRVVEARRYVAVARTGSLSRSHGVEDLEAMRLADERLMQLSDLSPAERAALSAHARHLQQKITYRKALETKASGDLPAAIRLCASDVGTLIYILDQTARAKLGAASALAGRDR